MLAYIIYFGKLAFVGTYIMDIMSGGYKDTTGKELKSLIMYVMNRTSAI